MEILNDRLAILGQEITRAQNNVRVSTDKLNALLNEKKNIEEIQKSAAVLPVKESYITQASNILVASSTLKDLTLIKAEITKATNILNTKTLSIGV